MTSLILLEPHTPRSYQTVNARAQPLENNRLETLPVRGHPHTSATATAAKCSPAATATNACQIAFWKRSRSHT